jgi:hypothetical protein
LIEVLAGLVLLGTILSSALVARGRFQRQWRAADEKLAAVRAADELIAKWIAQPPGSAPVPGEGRLGSSEHLRWRTRWRPDPAAQRLGVRVAEVEVYDPRHARSRPILRVDFLLRPRPPAPAATRPTTRRR